MTQSDPFYFNFRDKDYYQEALDKATEFFFDFDIEKRTAFLAQLREKSGTEIYDLLHNYYEGLKLVPHSISRNYKNQILIHIPPFLNKSQLFELYEMEILDEFRQHIPENRRIYTDKGFYKFFSAYLEEIVSISGKNQVWIISILSYEEQAVFFQFIKTNFIKTLALLYDEYQEDIEFIISNIKSKTGGIEKITYWFTFFDLRCDIAYYEESYDTRSREYFTMKIINKKIKKYENYFQNIFNYFNQGKLLQELIPSIKGGEKDTIIDFMTDKSLKLDFHNAYVKTKQDIAENDVRSAIVKFIQKDEAYVSFETNLKAGSVATQLNPTKYSDIQLIGEILTINNRLYLSGTLITIGFFTEFFPLFVGAAYFLVSAIWKKIKDE